jgi:predicted ferric reductase
MSPCSAVVLTELKQSPVRSYARSDPGPRQRERLGRVAIGVGIWTIVLGNTAGIVWLWWHGGNVTKVHTTGEALTSAARITGLLGAYLALIQVLLLARLPWLERLVGFDRLIWWHRWNGHACIDLIIAHVVLSVWGYSLMDKISISKEISTMLTGGIYPGMITATVGTVLLMAVVYTSVAIARRHLRYEWWYLVHLTAYAGIALGWFHQIPTGNELVLDRVAADYWRALYVVTLALLLLYRVAIPAANTIRFGMRVSEVVPEGPGVVSLRISGRALHRLNAQPGQFFLWRFLARGRWWASHPFSLSEAPRGDSLRITVKALGDFSSGIAHVRPGTRVVAEGPFGVFTDAVRRRDKVVLIAGGIGITPIRALIEQIEGDVVVLYRVLAQEDIVFLDELDSLAHERGVRIEYIVGDHATIEGSRLLSAEHLRELLPDIVEREVYVCGPPAMTNAIAKNVRRAKVPARQVHAERFAL